MMFECFNDLLTATPTLLAASQDAAQTASDLPARGELSPFLSLMVTTAVYVLSAGMACCLFRLVKGPELADRVMAADLLSLHVVGLVILLTIYVGNLVFFDAALVVSIIGFVSTIGFAQYIFATAPRTLDPEAPRIAQDTAATSGDSP